MTGKVLGLFATIVAALAVVGVAWASDDKASTESSTEASVAASAQAAATSSLGVDGSVDVETEVTAAITGATVTTTGDATVTTDDTTATSVDDDDEDDDRVGAGGELIVTSAGTFQVPGVGTVTIDIAGGSLILVEVNAPEGGTETTVIPTVGGTVTDGVEGGEVTYLSAVPAPGFALEIEDAGPPGVRVEFQSVTIQIEVRAEWVDGRLEVEIDTDD
ncbi:MAG: hypothetical protein L0Z63_10420 [Actinobacteria bacterium]|nr:hypothetical protein [Actinomycetota bacterium]